MAKRALIANPIREALEKPGARKRADAWLEKANEHFSAFTGRMVAFLDSNKIKFRSKKDVKAYDAWLQAADQQATLKAYIGCLNLAVGAAPGYAKALRELAGAYLGGWGVPKSRTEALRLLGCATAGANPEEFWKMSQLIRLEDNGAESWLEGMKAAEQMCRIAAEKGHAGAQYSLGEMYVKGDAGLRRDDDLARFWLSRAAENGEFPPAEGQFRFLKSKHRVQRLNRHSRFNSTV